MTRRLSRFGLDQRHRRLIPTAAITTGQSYERHQELERRQLQPPVASSLEVFTKLFGGKARVPRDSTHGERIDGIVARNGDDALSIGHHDVLALTRDSEADFLEHPDCVEMIDARDLRHALTYLDLADIAVLKQLISHDEVLANGLTNIRERLGLSRALRPATWKSRH